MLGIIEFRFLTKKELFFPNLEPQGKEKVNFFYPQYLTVHEDTIYIPDYANKRIQVFALPSGQFIRSWNTNGFCVAVAYYESLLYVSFVVINTIRVYNLEGKEVRKWNTGGLRNPSCLAVADEIVYVADSENDRIVLFSTQGVVYGKWSGDAEGSFNRPNGILIQPVKEKAKEKAKEKEKETEEETEKEMPELSIYISDRYWVREFDVNGKCRKKFGGEKILTRGDQFAFLDECLFIADYEDHQITVFQ